MNESLERRIIALQYWDGDREAAMRLARFIEEMEPAKNPHVDFLFVVREDAEAPDEAVIKTVARKFNVQTFRAPYSGRGHPAGCWVLWFSAIEWLLKKVESGEAVKWMMTVESDCVPLTRDWIERLDSEWDRHVPGIRMMGADPMGGVTHLNGNQFVSGNPDMLRWIVRELTLAAVPAPEGWDTWLFPDFLRWGCFHTSLMFSQWNTRSVRAGYHKILSREGRVFFHGVKDDSLMRETRRHFFKRA
jgi:hypothetical protein